MAKFVPGKCESIGPQQHRQARVITTPEQRHPLKLLNGRTWLRAQPHKIPSTHARNLRGKGVGHMYRLPPCAAGLEGGLGRSGVTLRGRELGWKGGGLGRYGVTLRGREHARTRARAQTRMRARANTRTCARAHARTRARARGRTRALAHARTRARAHARSRGRAHTRTRGRAHNN